MMSIDGSSFNLASADGRQAAVEKMNLSEFQQGIITPILTEAYRNSRDELGKLALIWANAERGGTMPHRMVISAHHAGSTDFWGTKNGIISFEQIQKLALAFPKAAAAIQHVHFSACYSALKMMMWLRVFPNVMSMWSYSGSAPGSVSGAVLHLRLWEKATRGNKSRVHRTAAKGTRKGANVTVWSRGYGIEEEVVEPIETLRQREQGERHVFTEYFAGNQLVVETDVGPLRDYYNIVMTMLNHIDLSEAERPALEKKRETTVRLIFYQKEIRGKFQETYGDEMKAGFAALKLEAPNFARLDRKQAISAIGDFERKAGANPPAATKRCLRLLTAGLRDLSPDLIPVNWI